MNRIRPSEHAPERIKGRERALRKWAEMLPSISAEDQQALSNCLSKFSHLELCRAFVIEDYHKGVGRQLIRRRYGLTEHEYRRIGIEAGYFKPKSF